MCRACILHTRQICANFVLYAVPFTSLDRISWNDFLLDFRFSEFMDYKTQFEESDNIFLRATRTVTDAVSDTFRGMTQPSEISKTVNEVRFILLLFSQFEWKWG